MYNYYEVIKEDISNAISEYVASMDSNEQEWWDVLIRCYLLGMVLPEVIAEKF